MSKDISLFSSASGADSFGLNNVACEGISKVANTFLMLLLTDAQTVPSDSARGTCLIRAVEVGRLRRDDEVYALFNLAVSDIKDYLRPLEVAYPDSEAFGSAELVAWAADGGRLTMKIKITARDGQTVTAVTPVDYR